MGAHFKRIDYNLDEDNYFEVTEFYYLYKVERGDTSFNDKKEPLAYYFDLNNTNYLDKRIEYWVDEEMDGLNGNEVLYRIFKRNK